LRDAVTGRAVAELLLAVAPAGADGSTAKTAKEPR